MRATEQYSDIEGLDKQMEEEDLKIPKLTGGQGLTIVILWANIVLTADGIFHKIENFVSAS